MRTIFQFIKDRSLLVRTIGFPATLVHGDTGVLDRWLWLKRRLPETQNDEAVIDVGCGSGGFSIGAARRGYQALGLSWSASAQIAAQKRAEICRARAAFEVLDIRFMASRPDLVGRFDVAICTEVIEHIVDDRRLMVDLANCLKPGGRLLMTAPNYYSRHLWAGDSGPFPKIEDGGHMRKGYSDAMFRELCAEAGLIVEEISYCSGYFSQYITVLMQRLARVHELLGWGLTFPLRIVPLMFDRIFHAIFLWPFFSVGLVAYKPRFATTGRSSAADPSSMEK